MAALGPDDALTVESSHYESASSQKSENLANTDEESDSALKEQTTKCLRGQKCCLSCCRPCLVAYNPLPSDATFLMSCAHKFRCPPHGKVSEVLTFSLAVILFWIVLLAVTEEAALPGGNIFALIVLFLLCLLGGELVTLIHLPALLGMLIVGCLLRNLPKVNIGADIDPQWSSALRNIALVVILIRAGLGLDPVALKKLSFGVLRLAFCPCLTETMTVAVASHFLMGFPWIWGFMLGFVLSAVSPAVVVPSMLSLSMNGYGTSKGIPTLVIAAASVDDVLAISGFGVALGIAFSKGNLVLTLFKGPLEAVAGIVYGLVLGLLWWYLPHSVHKRKTLMRFLLVFIGGLTATFGSRAVDLAGAGALGCLTLAFVAAIGWRRETGGEEAVADIMAVLWWIFQPLLFGLIGAEIDIANIQGKTIGYGVAVLAIGMSLRMVASFLAVFGLGFTWKEKFFIPFAWLPKATVQAAIGSYALDTARDKGAPEEQIELGIQVLTIAVLVILITAPLGAIAIALTAPRLLEKTPQKMNQEMTVLSLDDNEEMVKEAGEKDLTLI